jgi:WD40 repeat protein
VTAALLSRDGTRCATVGADWTARIWEVATGKQLARPLLHDSPVVSAAFTEDGTRIVTIDRHAVRTWDVALDTRSLKQWSDVAGRSPYVYWRGVLMLRSAAAGMTDDSEPDDEPSGSFFEPAQGLGELDPRNFFGTRDDEVDRPQP